LADKARAWLQPTFADLTNYFGWFPDGLPRGILVASSRKPGKGVTVHVEKEN
jgi:hypothetical protein